MVQPLKCNAKPSMLDVCRRLHSRDFRFIDLEEAQLLEAIAYDMQGWCLVIGHPESGSYEWVLLEANADIHSDRGYGQPAAALRDGLIEALGSPDVPPAGGRP